MADEDFPIDINYAKITDWLVDRKLLHRDWRPRLAALQEQASSAARELSPGLAALLRDPWEEEREESNSSSSSVVAVVVDHPAALRIRDALVSSPETSTKSLLGAWTGPAGTWEKICRAYARGGNASVGKGIGIISPSSSSTEGCSLAVAEAALLLTKAVDFEIPALRASTSKGHQTLRDLERRAAEAERQAVAAAKDYRSERASLGIRAVASSYSVPSEPATAAVEGELRDLVGRELGPMIRSAVEALKSAAVTAGVEHYRSFVRYAHHDGSSSPSSSAQQVLLPALAEVRSAVLKEEEEEEEKEQPEVEDATSEAATATTTTAGDDAGGIRWDIDVSSSGAEETAAASSSPSASDDGGGGGISWDIETVGGAEDDVDPTTPAHLASASVAAADEKNIISKLASDASARASLGDDIAELSAFLTQRLAAIKGVVGNGSNFLPPDAPSELSSFYASPSSSSEAIQSALEGLRSAEDSLSGERASTLLLLSNPSGKGFERLAARLRSKAGAEGKFRALAAAASLRAEDVRRELAADAKNLRRAAAAARDARSRAEAMISAMISKNSEKARKVNVVGEVSAAISAAEAATGG